MNPEAIRQLQISLGLSPTGVFDNNTITAMTNAVGKAMSNNRDIARYAANNNPETILNAYMTGDWGGVNDLSGRPFTPQQQQAALKEAERALAPAYKAMETFDKSVFEDSLRSEHENLDTFRKDEARDFGENKDSLDQNAVSEGVLFSGSRVQKLNDLRTTYAEREAMARKQAADRIRSSARDYQYNYGYDPKERDRGLRSFYDVSESSSFNPFVAGGAVTPNRTLSAVYNPKEFNFQGTKPVAQKAAVNLRAAGLLGNRANKLSLSGLSRQY